MPVEEVMPNPLALRLTADVGRQLIQTITSDQKRTMKYKHNRCGQEHDNISIKVK